MLFRLSAFLVGGGGRGWGGGMIASLLAVFAGCGVCVCVGKTGETS